MMESESESARKDSDYMVYKFAAAEYHETRTRLLQIHCMQIRGDVGGAHCFFVLAFDVIYAAADRFCCPTMQMNLPRGHCIIQKLSTLTRKKHACGFLDRDFSHSILNFN
jgi:hypothetical protein